jgi:hypothetical protein
MPQGSTSVLRSFLGPVAILVLVVESAVAQGVVPRVSAGCPGIEVVSDELTRAEADKYCDYAAGERKKVEKFWGATWTGPIRIHVSSSFSIARSLVTNGGKPGNTEMPLARVRDERGALLHEITHSYAPNANRFLQEGLAVYLQEKLGGNPAFPNFGRKLHAAAGNVLGAVSSLEALNSVRFPRPLSAVVDERTGYLLAGSFVEFLIEKYGLPQFRTLYESGDYEQAYQEPLRVLEKEWRSRVDRR